MPDNTFINKVYFINLDRCPHRYWAMMGTLHAADVPYEMVERFPAKDGRDYEHTFDVVEAMVKDGFSEFDAFRGYESYWHQPKNMCVQWSHLSVLRLIVERNETALVFEDDGYLRILFWNLDSICGNLTNIELLYLDNFHWSGVDPDPTRSEYMAEEEQFIKELKPTQYPSIVSNSYGMGARVRVFTPHGAERFLAESLKRPWAGSETVGWYMKREGVSVENHYLFKNESPSTRPSFPMWDPRFLGE